MKYAIYYKYKPLLEILENNSYKSYRELELSIKNYLIENNENLIKSVNKCLDLKLHETQSLLKGLDIKVSSEKLNKYIDDTYFESELNTLLVKKTKQIINALNLVSFTNINILNSTINIYEAEKVLSPSYYKIKGYYYNKSIEIEDKTFTSFISNFGNTLEEISKEELDYINKCIDTERKKNSEPVFITIESIYEIRFIRYIIKTLERSGITTNNYKSDMKTKCEDHIYGLSIFGIKAPYEFTFDNPTKLYAEIDFILTSTGLNDNQKKVFYKELDIRKRNPKKSDVQEVSEVLEDNQLMSEVAKYPLEQLEAIINKNNDYQFNEDYQTHLTKYGIEKILDAITRIDNNIASTQEDTKKWFEYTNELDKKIIDKLFTTTSKFRIPYLFDLEYDILN